MSVGIKANNQRPAPHFLDQLQRLSRIKEVSVVNMESPISDHTDSHMGDCFASLIVICIFKKTPCSSLMPK